ncbi:uncharacterized protein MJAP1_002614 [Malassezia japonica]|uniref:Rhodanese domain-containing protein n=1 Tax=Malassezia japonica TaxID=223818 RepID=A0AAF0F4D2_9BASI|nr:uncharacterized protein MJAP1_002614 [Malassezia japonica]WFD39634.1 hypothetical protein MJAP1_002614 [Malassezia japonica]
MQSLRPVLRSAPIAARIAARAPAASVARVAVAQAQPTLPRSISTSSVVLKEDRSWVDKGPITYEELKPYTETPSGKIDIIDVREPNEVAQGIIPSAVNVPLSEFSAAFDVNSESVSSTDFERRFSFPRPTYDHEIVFYCRSGRRSQEALEIARQRGWWNTRNYPGSWSDWVKHEKDNKNEDDD